MGTSAEKKRVEGDTSVRTSCEKCGVALEADVKDAGKKATCPNCKAGVIIPGEAPRATGNVGKPNGGGNGNGPDSQQTRRPLQNGRRADNPLFAHKASLPPPMTPVARPVGTATVGTAISQTRETHRMRAKVTGWLRRVVIVVMAFTVLQIFDACFSSILLVAPADLHAAVRWIGEAVSSIPGGLRLLMVPRPVDIGFLMPIERFVLGLGMLLYATRMVVRTKLLDAVYVTTVRWHERTVLGLVMHFLAALLLAGLLAWAASTTTDTATTDGLTCGLLAAMLAVSAVWLLSLHLVAGSEYPELTKWMLTDAAFCAAVLLVTICPGITVLWSRAGAVAVLLLADSAVALHVGASFVFARRKPQWWWRKPLSIVLSAILVLLVAVLLACMR